VSWPALLCGLLLVLSLLWLFSFVLPLLMRPLRMRMLLLLLLFASLTEPRVSFLFHRIPTTLLPLRLSLPSFLQHHLSLLLLLLTTTTPIAVAAPAGHAQIVERRHIPRVRRRAIEPRPPHRLRGLIG
jgi:hypothetical protein